MRIGPLSTIAGVLLGGLAATALISPAAAQPSPAGDWESPGHRLQLQVAGHQVSGTFRRTVGERVTEGTVKGQLDATGRLLALLWAFEIDGEESAFSSSLALSPDGQILDGYYWGHGGAEVPTSMSLRRAAGERPGEFLDEDTVDQGATPPVPPPTNDPPVATDDAPAPEEDLKITPRGTSASPAGRWTVSFNSVFGRMEISQTGAGWTGGLDLDGAPEPLADVTFEAATGTVRFVRPGCDQHYVGTLTADVMRGTFGTAEEPTQYEWSATRERSGADAEPEPVASGEPVTLLDNSNTTAVDAVASAPTVLSLKVPHMVTYIRTYHWNGGAGSPPGTIGLRGADGTGYGPWQATGTGDDAGRRNIMWVVEPHVSLPAGEYEIVDSDRSTWAANSRSGGAGFAWVNGIPVGGRGVPEPTPLFDNSNPNRATTGPTAPTVFTLDRPHRITRIQTSHPNAGRGVEPGLISLVDRDGTGYGTWQATGVPDQRGRKNALWQVEPNVDLPAGTYTIVDSDPATWVTNQRSGNAGFAWVWGAPR